MINELSKQIHENAKSKGFHDKEANIGQQLMLIVTEVAEACEADRVGKYPTADVKSIYNIENDRDFKIRFEAGIKNTLPDELADIMMRTMDLAGLLEIDLESHIKAKMRYNSTRERMHGKKY